MNATHIHYAEPGFFVFCWKVYSYSAGGFAEIGMKYDGETDIQAIERLVAKAIRERKP